MLNTLNSTKLLKLNRITIYLLKVALHGVTAEGDELDSALREASVDLLHASDLGGADGREICRVAEEHGPGAAQPLVEALHAAGGGVSRKVRHDVAQADGGLAGALHRGAAHDAAVELIGGGVASIPWEEVKGKKGGSALTTRRPRRLSPGLQ